MYTRRLRVLALSFGLALLAVAAKLTKLQLIDGHVYAELARKGRIWSELSSAPRGRILDANGNPLAYDEPEYGLAIVASEFPLQFVRLTDIRELEHLSLEERALARESILERLKLETALGALEALSCINREAIASGVLGALERASRYGSERIPEPVIFGLDRQIWLKLQMLLNPVEPRAPRSQNVPIPGIRCVFRPRRAYPFGVLACHVIGHVGEYGPEELNLLRSFGVLPDMELAGALGMKKLMEDQLAAKAFAREFGWPPGSEPLAERLISLAHLGRDAKRRLEGELGPVWPTIETWLERGILAELSEGELVWLNARGHLEDRRIGKMGVERAQNVRLRGRHGYKVVIKNISTEDGRIVPELDYLRAERPSAGEDVELELDVAFQQAVESILDATGLPGAAVFIEPWTGKVLALASRPGFDPNVFTPGLGKGRVADILSDPGKPLLNRASQGLYPPGSVLKPLWAVAALEEGILSPLERIRCDGTYEVDGRTFRCLSGHGELRVSEAIAQSCNVFFYHVAERLGAERCVRWARELGLATRTGLDLPGESPGILPSVEEARSLSRRSQVQLGIGQGPIAVTPLQMANLYACLATEMLCRPHVVRSATRLTKAFKISDGTRLAIMEGLLAAVHSPSGTAYEAFNLPPVPGERSFAGEFPDIKVAGKTGTAEHGGGAPHSWFAGFAPADRPQIAFAVLIECGGGGGRAAAPAAARMLATYFRLGRHHRTPHGEEPPR